ncbi:MAG TPA: transcriptional repressor [Ignavibacteria bacterium]|nr:transcriptional repressor [Ignavibacteria bacterium]
MRSKEKDKELLEVLCTHSLRVTSPRVEILQILRANHNPLTISEIHSKIKSKGTDLATVYRTINSFLKFNIVNEVDFKDEFKRYELIFDRHHHHHVVCKVCKKVENVDFCVGNNIEKDLKKRGYKNISHSLEFFGICQDCAE